MTSMTICVTLITMSRGCTWHATDGTRRICKEVLQVKTGNSAQFMLRDASEFPFFGNQEHRCNESMHMCVSWMQKSKPCELACGRLSVPTVRCLLAASTSSLFDVIIPRPLRP